MAREVVLPAALERVVREHVVVPVAVLLAAELVLEAVHRFDALLERLVLAVGQVEQQVRDGAAAHALLVLRSVLRRHGHQALRDVAVERSAHVARVLLEPRTQRARLRRREHVGVVEVGVPAGRFLRGGGPCAERADSQDEACEGGLHPLSVRGFGVPARHSSASRSSTQRSAGLRDGSLDPHQEGVQVLGLDEAVAAGSAGAVAAHAGGGHHLELERVLFAIGDASRERAERHALEGLGRRGRRRALLRRAARAHVARRRRRRRSGRFGVAGGRRRRIEARHRRRLRARDAHRRRARLGAQCGRRRLCFGRGIGHDRIEREGQLRRGANWRRATRRAGARPRPRGGALAATAKLGATGSILKAGATRFGASARTTRGGVSGAGCRRLRHRVDAQLRGRRWRRPHGLGAQRFGLGRGRRSCGLDQGLGRRLGLRLGERQRLGLRLHQGLGFGLRLRQKLFGRGLDQHDLGQRLVAQLLLVRREHEHRDGDADRERERPGRAAHERALVERGELVREARERIAGALAHAEGPGREHRRERQSRRTEAVALSQSPARHRRSLRGEVGSDRRPPALRPGLFEDADRVEQILAARVGMRREQWARRTRSAQRGEAGAQRLRVEALPLALRLHALGIRQDQLEGTRGAPSPASSSG